ncbi:hypothetical protein JRO89_XS07G0252400 [Xanthoceras sorbifolium]|uniref:Uncharacterized protein n=1 Tax=Xanthoceras sorbifolium TaxID=99658 RepID=A0ABQ8HV44_9ROSI|nr:hypothetical protein JRO89_XS07G0252400 [Xanthoceras sorbifolium]
MGIYDVEKVKTTNLLEANNCRIAITTDLWTASSQRKGYMAVTAHFVDESWCLQSRILRAFNQCRDLVDEYALKFKMSEGSSSYGESSSSSQLVKSTCRSKKQAERLSAKTPHDASFLEDSDGDDNGDVERSLCLVRKKCSTLAFPPNLESLSVLDFFFSCKVLDTASQFELLAIIWRVWFRRNKLVRKEGSIPAED